MMPRVLGSHDRILWKEKDGPVFFKNIPLGCSVEDYRLRQVRKWAGKMAQQAEELAVKPNDLSLILGSHMKEGEKHLQQVSSDLHT